MDMMWRSTLSSLLTMESVKPNWLNFIPQTSPKTHYLPRYLIPQFLLERIMVNVLLYMSVLCGANQFKPQIGPWDRYATLCKTVYRNRHWMKKKNEVNRNMSKIAQKMNQAVSLAMYGTIPKQLRKHKMSGFLTSKSTCLVKELRKFSWFSLIV